MRAHQQDTWIIIFVSGSVRTFRSSGASFSLLSCRTLTTACDSRLNNPLAASRGRSTKTDIQLKQSWTVAPEKALEWTVSGFYFCLHILIQTTNVQLYLSNSSLSATCMSATIVLVTDVPMLEPMIIGMADSTVNTVQQRWQDVGSFNHTTVYTCDDVWTHNQRRPGWLWWR